MLDGTVVRGRQPAVEERTSSQTERTDPAAAAAEEEPQAAEVSPGTGGPGQQAVEGQSQKQ